MDFKFPAVVLLSTSRGAAAMDCDYGHDFEAALLFRNYLHPYMSGTA